MTAMNFKLKIRHGAAEFEAEGTQKFVEAKLQEFKPMLNLPKAEKAEKAKVKNGRRGRRAKKERVAYPIEAIKPLRAFLKTTKPKKKLDIALAIAEQHMKHFKVASFTNKDLSSAATAVGKKLGNVSALLKTAIKAKRISKLGKGTWQLIEGKPALKAKASKPRNVRKVKPAPKARVKKSAQPQPQAVSPKKTAKPKVKPFPKPNASKQPVQPAEPAPPES